MATSVRPFIPLHMLQLRKTTQWGRCSLFWVSLSISTFLFMQQSGFSAFKLMYMLHLIFLDSYTASTTWSVYFSKICWDLRCPIYSALFCFLSSLCLLLLYFDNFKYFPQVPLLRAFAVKHWAWPSLWFIHEVQWGRPLMCVNYLKSTLFFLNTSSLW